MSTAWPTTSAPSRPPRSSGSEPATASGACANCGATLGGPYCAACGQRAAPPDPTLRDLAEEAWDAFVSVDGKLVNSVRLLVLRPGEMTARYLAGHRARFIPPLRLYLACSVAYFLVEARLPEDARSLHVRAGGVRGTRQPLSANDAVAGVSGPEWSRRIQRGTRRAAYADQASFTAQVLDRIPQAMFGLVPLQAALLALVYRRRRMRYPAHLVFALHSHAAVFALLAAAGVLAALAPGTARGAVGVAAMLLLVTYVLVAMRRVYGGRWRATAARGALVGAGYVLGLAAALAVVVFGTFYVMGAPTTAAR